MPFHELKNIAPIFLRVGTLTSSSASATLSDDSTANPPKPMRQNAWPIRALAGFKRLISVIKYQELMPDPFDAVLPQALTSVHSSLVVSYFAMKNPLTFTVRTGVAIPSCPI